MADSGLCGFLGADRCTHSLRVQVWTCSATSLRWSYTAVGVFSSFHGIITLGGGESDDFSSFPLVRIKELSSTSKHRAKKKPLYHMHLLQNCCFSPLWRRWFLLKTSVGFTEQIFVDCKVISKNRAVLSSLCNHLPEDKMCTAIVSFEEKLKFLFRIL